MERAPSSSRRASVSEDWRSWLVGRKDEVFRACLKDLESSYIMLSVSLNEAIELVNCGRYGKACQAVCVTPDLCQRLAITLAALLHQMAEHSRHYGTVPNAVPLDATNFRCPREQRAARLNDLLSHALLTQRSQFLYKLNVLEEMVQDLQSEFCAAAEELSSGDALHPAPLWKTLDASHFDLNTCLREAIVVLKSFFVVLPEDQVQAFESSIRRLCRRDLVASGRKFFRLGTGRAASVAGK